MFNINLATESHTNVFVQIQNFLLNSTTFAFENMNTKDKILITGAAGFIASCMAQFLNRMGYHNLYLVDDFTPQHKIKNHESIICLQRIERDKFSDFLEQPLNLDYIIHFGARTDTTEMDYSIHEKLNLEYSKQIWRYCTLNQIPLIYASSAATYGNGELGYEDSHELPQHLKPLNPYGISKNEFDIWVLAQDNQPPQWQGLKFFNVYGPNEYHKNRMASVIFHAFNQIKSNGSLKLFKSHHPDFADGGQMRDFVYVKDVLNVTYWLMTHDIASGLYNLGTGKAETFNELAFGIFDTLDLPRQIEYIDTPLDIRDKYQYYTQANMTKLKEAGYHQPFFTLRQGIEDYVNEYLTTGKMY